MKAEKTKDRRKWYRSLHRYTRFGVQVLFFVLFPSAYASAFAGVKYIFTQIGAHQIIGLTPFVAILIALCAYTVVFGRFFCGYACAFGSLNDWIFGLHKTLCGKRMKRPAQIPEKVMAWLSLLKYVVLALIAILCVLQCFDKTQGWSPWDAFSQLRAGQIGQLGAYTIGCILLGMLLVGMFFSERFFCRVFCPMGAIFSLLPVLPLLTVRRDRNACIHGCNGCTRVCPASLELPDITSYETPGECFQCQQCTGVCPRRNVLCKGRRVHGDESQLMVIRVLILAGLFIWLGV